MRDPDTYSLMQPANQHAGNVEFRQFSPQKSKTITEEINNVLAGNYGFTAERLDFIINNNLKYRMGREMENGKEEV